MAARLAFISKVFKSLDTCCTLHPKSFNCQACWLVSKVFNLQLTQTLPRLDHTGLLPGHFEMTAVVEVLYMAYRPKLWSRRAMVPRHIPDVLGHGAVRPHTLPCGLFGRVMIVANAERAARYTYELNILLLFASFKSLFIDFGCFRCCCCCCCCFVTVHVSELRQFLAVDSPVSLRKETTHTLETVCKCLRPKKNSIHSTALLSSETLKTNAGVARGRLGTEPTNCR